MGHHVADCEFRVVDLTIQTKGGTVSRFIRAVAGFARKLTEFFNSTDHHYTEYNYLGEWHSHPLFALQPSTDDLQTMRDIVDDPEVGANFVVLMIVKLVNEKVVARAWSLLPDGVFVDAQVQFGEFCEQ